MTFILYGYETLHGKRVWTDDEWEAHEVVGREDGYRLIWREVGEIQYA